MPVRDRVERPGADGAAHGASWTGWTPGRDAVLALVLSGVNVPEHGLAVLLLPAVAQALAARPARVRARAALDDHHRAGHQPAAVAQGGEVGGELGVAAGRTAGRGTPRRTARTASARASPATGPATTSARLKPRSAGVRRDHRGGTPVVLDQRDHAGAARPGLEADRAGAGVQVEEAQPGQATRTTTRSRRRAPRARGRSSGGCSPPAASRSSGRRPSPDDPRHGRAGPPRAPRGAVMTSP